MRRLAAIAITVLSLLCLVLWLPGNIDRAVQSAGSGETEGGISLDEVLAVNGCFDPGARAIDRNGGDAFSFDAKPGEMLGGDIAPSRSVLDPYPTFHSVAVDPENNITVISDSSRKGLMIYDRAAGGRSTGIARTLTEIRGPATGMTFIAGVAIDPARKEAYTVNNDIGDRMVVFSYDDEGNARPRRVLHVPHQAWGLSLNRDRDEMAVTVEASNMIVVYRREAKGEDAPLRVIRGARTGLGDPHGVYFDSVSNELIVANHGNKTTTGGGDESDESPRAARDARDRGGRGGVEFEEGSRGQASVPYRSREPYVGGHFYPPSITVYPGTAQGDVEPTRTIHGPHTELNWPMALDVDTVNNEIAVANSGANSILIFRRTDKGAAAPVRVIRGARTALDHPMGVSIDKKNNEIWVSNYNDHTAIVFSRTANGNVAPKRIIRNAPEGAPTSGFGNPGAIAYDSKRGEILVPN